MANKAMQVEVLLAGVRDDSDAPLNGGIAKFYEPGTTTYKTVWSDAGKGTAITQPLTLNLHGRVTVFADGEYDVLITTAGGATVYDWKKVTFNRDDFADVRAYGAKGDGSNDTDAVRKAFDSLAAEVYFPTTSGVYRIDTITVPTATKRIFGEGTLKQRTANTNILNVSGVTNLTIEDLTFEGFGSSTAGAANNNGVDISNSSQITIRNCRFTQLGWHAIYVKECSDIQVEGNRVTDVALPIYFRGSTILRVCENFIASPMLITDPGPFHIAIALESTNSGTNPICSDAIICGNIIEGYNKGQTIMAHAGRRIIVSGNILRDALYGFGFNPAGLNVPTDVMFDVVACDNIYSGTTTTHTNPDSNFGFFVGGGPGGTGETPRPQYTVIRSNVIYKANVVRADHREGGIGIGWADYVLVAGNICSACYAAGIVFVNPTTKVLLRANKLEDAVTAGGVNTGIHIWEGDQTTTVSGMFRDNYVYNNSHGILFSTNSGNSTSLYIRDNWIRANTAAYNTTSKAVIEWDQIGTKQADVAQLTNQSSVAVAFAVAQPDTNYRVALGANFNQTCWVTGKATTGFTINVPTATTDTVEWQLERL